MRLLIRFLRRLLIFGLGVFGVWLIVLSSSGSSTTGCHGFWLWRSPMASRLMLSCRVPFAWVSRSCSASRCRVSRSPATGCPAIRSISCSSARCNSFAPPLRPRAGSEADRLGLASSWRMVRAFVFNSPYPTAPFSTLYLFGRGQDIGFQKAIDNSPRKRHHIRFWALSLAQRRGHALGTAASGSTPTGRRTMRAFSGSAPAPGIPASR